jgi:protein-tyrosine-phosphatase
MTGLVKKSDVIITLDKKTFYPICQDFKTSECILAYPQLFKHSEHYIFEYDYDNVDNFINDITFKTLNEIEAEKPNPSIQVDSFGTETPNEKKTKK